MAMASITLPKTSALQWKLPGMQFLPSPRPASVRFASSLPPISCITSTFNFKTFADDDMTDEGVDKYHEPVAVVTGASRGLGLEFTRQLLVKYPGTVVYGTARNPDASEGLKALKRRHPIRMEIGRLDVTREETVQELATEIGEKYGRVDLIVNCAGVLHIPGYLEPESAVSMLEPEKLMLPFEVNAMGPIIVAKHFWELLKIGKGTATGRQAAVIANISHKCGSVKDNTLAGWYGYRASKTALNMMTRTLALEALRRKDPIICVLLHPGTVNTELSRPFASKVPNMKLFAPDYAVERLLGIINKVRFEDNGKFTSWDRQEVPW